jgi:hypothetical protein
MRFVLDVLLLVVDLRVRHRVHFSLVFGRWLHLYLSRWNFMLVLGPWTFSAGDAVRGTEGKFFMVEPSIEDARTDYQKLSQAFSSW